MITILDIYSVTLLLISLTMFVLRFLREEPPVTPYLIIACTCGVGNFLADRGGDAGALMLLVAASFLFLGCLLYPQFRGIKRDKPETAHKAPQGVAATVPE